MHPRKCTSVCTCDYTYSVNVGVYSSVGTPKTVFQCNCTVHIHLEGTPECVCACPSLYVPCVWPLSMYLSVYILCTCVHVPLCTSRHVSVCIPLSVPLTHPFECVTACVSLNMFLCVCSSDHGPLRMCLLACTSVCTFESVSWNEPFRGVHSKLKLTDPPPLLGLVLA